MEFVILSFIFAIVSALCSGLEAAVIAINLYEISKLNLTLKKLRKIENIIIGKRILIFLFLFFNTLANVGFSISIYFLFVKLNLPEWTSVILSILIITPFLFIFSELLPKLISRHYKEDIILLVANLLYPISLLNKLFPSSSSPQSLANIISVIQDELDKEEDKEIYNFLSGMLNLDEYTVKELMVPITNVPVLLENLKVKDAINYLTSSDVSKILISDGFKIVGYVDTRDLISLPKNEILGNVRRDIKSIIYENSNIKELIDSGVFDDHLRLNIVVNDISIPVGIIDLSIFASRILDLILISRERLRGRKSFVFDGSTNLRYLFIALGISYENIVNKFPYVEKVFTLSGLILEINKSLPKIGDKIEFMGINFEILSVSKYSIDKVRVIT